MGSPTSEGGDSVEMEVDEDLLLEREVPEEEDLESVLEHSSMRSEEVRWG